MIDHIHISFVKCFYFMYMDVSCVSVSVPNVWLVPSEIVAEPLEREL